MDKLNLMVDEVLDVLSNNYRREILRLLTTEDRYAFELAKILDISQRAVTKHLKYLQDLNLVRSEKRKSSKGPAREYYMLEQSIVVSMTIAPNLFLSTVRPLDESKAQSQITPSLQLSAPNDDKDNVLSVLSEGIDLLPQIKEGLDLLQAQQSKLFRAYQGLQSHITDALQQRNLNDDEIRFLLDMIENEGIFTAEDIQFVYGDIGVVMDAISSLREKGIIEYFEINDETGVSYKYIMKTD